MSGKTEEGSGFLILMVGVALASSLAVVTGLWELSQKSGGDASSNNDYLQVEQASIIRTIRKITAGEFADTIVGCLSPRISRDQILTKQQVEERLNTALGNFSELDNDNTNQCKNLVSRAWTFSLPCKLTINRPPAWLSGQNNLGDMTICGTAMAESIHSAMGGCVTSADFPGCLANAVVANNDVQKQIDKPLDSQKMSSP